MEALLAVPGAEFTEKGLDDLIVRHMGLQQQKFGKPGWAQAFEDIPGVYPVKGYPAYPDKAVRVPVKSFPLGYHYSKHLKRLRENGASSSRSRTESLDFRFEAIVRTVNNRVYQNMTSFAWQDVIRSGNDGNWNALEQDILDFVKGDFLVQVSYLDSVYVPEKLDKETHWKLLARSCMGNGHAKVMESLERVSGAEATRHQLF
ncbi:hypothetical protein BKA58DRAFT_438670 [Alternaria rosae]|uniref:uncharacterized protein n=1 Tax=Alternaria rosae TaxID=1187941 RepID=UPI001E8E63EB|nr:uncharacterized protein BKA58DRAFT_438670 [Alternaria rosae]KAH6872562.1 hypothetical protein BKA58DRAFT_438670 [Alternaria rosae]